MTDTRLEIKRKHASKQAYEQAKARVGVLIDRFHIPSPEPLPGGQVPPYRFPDDPAAEKTMDIRRLALRLKRWQGPLMSDAARLRSDLALLVPVYELLLGHEMLNARRSLKEEGGRIVKEELIAEATFNSVDLAEMAAIKRDKEGLLAAVQGKIDLLEAQYWALSRELTARGLAVEEAKIGT